MQKKYKNILLHFTGKITGNDICDDNVKRTTIGDCGNVSPVLLGFEFFACV
jgi:hypothetical protein